MKSGYLHYMLMSNGKSTRGKLWCDFDWTTRLFKIEQPRDWQWRGWLVDSFDTKFKFSVDEGTPFASVEDVGSVVIYISEKRNLIKDEKDMMKSELIRVMTHVKDDLINNLNHLK